MSQKIRRLLYADHARKDLKKLDKEAALRIVNKIKENSELKNPLSRAKELKGVLSGLYRYRIGDYRIIFEYDNMGKIIILTILIIKHRKDSYKT